MEFKGSTRQFVKYKITVRNDLIIQPSKSWFNPNSVQKCLRGKWWKAFETASWAVNNRCVRIIGVSVYYWFITLFLHSRLKQDVQADASQNLKVFHWELDSWQAPGLQRAVCH